MQDSADCTSTVKVVGVKTSTDREDHQDAEAIEGCSSLGDITFDSVPLDDKSHVNQTYITSN